ncbi:homocysteine S-methyltransferase 1 [Teleopsis dalmanni]|uniref:homocysteine S-methyltransferase 1 n=1 Tax=Teleopsis dalmanni TaxID=139649 RepID=UPI0018CCB80B|nr:homocysteine S-methyltransferase 1 [Teleopsis dalmanni]XP_037958401.1 homocysteine S-methyltransferase 1 [Teleopsis dalmanni]
MSLSRILVKDGGFGTQMTVHVGNAVDGDPLWSARFNATKPAAIINTHMDFLRNGADIILTNTYQASVEGYVNFLDLSVPESIELIRNTVRLAHIAKERYLTECYEETKIMPENIPMIIASIGPFGAHLHDGSEYTGSYADYVSPKKITDWHRVRIDACLEAGVDALAIETIPCQVEAEALVEMLCDDYPDVKFWVSFQCKDDKTLAHGEDFADAALSIWELLKERNAQHNCLAIGVNCVHPKYVSSLFNNLNGDRSDAEKVPLVVYPNSGELYDVVKGWMGREHCIPLENYVPEWTQLGAKIIGGCCRTYARDIRNISEAVRTINTLMRWK